MFMNYKKTKLLITLLSLLTLSGCAKFWDSASAKGGVFISEKAPYIIVNSSGGVIQDVYLLDNSIIQSPKGSDGWLFLDNLGQPVYLGGDVKTIRLTKSNKDRMFSQYTEFHILLDGLNYKSYVHKRASEQP